MHTHAPTCDTFEHEECERTEAEQIALAAALAVVRLGCHVPGGPDDAVAAGHIYVGGNALGPGIRMVPYVLSAKSITHITQGVSRRRHGH